MRSKIGRFSCLFVFLYIFSAAISFAAPTGSPMAEFEERRRAVAAEMEAATVWIVAESGGSFWSSAEIYSGTGFVVADGLIVTNAHVVENLGKNPSVHVLNERIPVREAKIVNTVHDKTNNAQMGGRDFALLRFTPPKGEKLPALSFNFDTRRMDRVSAWGYPVMVTQFDKSTQALLEEGNTENLTPAPVVYTEGAVNAVVEGGLGAAIIHSASIAGGNSGGPLVNGRGEVVGMNTWGYKEEDEGAFLNGAQPAESIVQFLIENGVTPNLAQGQSLASIKKRPPASGKPDRREERDTDNIRVLSGFSVKVPDDWSVIDEDDTLILLASDDDTSAVGLFVGDSEGNSLKSIASEFSEEFGGTEPVRGDDIYTFSFTDEDDVETAVFIGKGEDEKQYVMLFITGDMENPGVEKILDSLE